jgi:hypothetical protein
MRLPTPFQVFYVADFQDAHSRGPSHAETGDVRAEGIHLRIGHGGRRAPPRTQCMVSGQMSYRGPRPVRGEVRCSYGAGGGERREACPVNAQSW